MSNRHAIVLPFSVSRNEMIFLSSIGSSFSKVNTYYFYNKLFKDVLLLMTLRIVFKMPPPLFPVADLE